MLESATKSSDIFDLVPNVSKCFLTLPLGGLEVAVTMIPGNGQS